MKIETKKYKDYVKAIPEKGKHILAQQQEDNILVYQAYRNSIADYAVKHQHFGGKDYSYERMSWIKPNFLWMMYRCGWASKPGQERVLGIWLKKSDFDIILENSVHSSYQQDIYETHENWKATLTTKSVRLQWDPDHDPFGAKQERKAIQLGIKGDLLHAFGKEMILKIEEVSDFVLEQGKIVQSGNLDELRVPTESVYVPQNEPIQKSIGLTKYQTIAL